MINKSKCSKALITTMLVLGAAACSKSDAGNTESASSSTSIAPPTSTDQSALPNLPKAQTVDLQANHPNGTVIRVTGASFHDDHIEVQMTVTNGRPDYVSKLNQSNMLLRDDQNVAYRVAPPPNNPTLEIASGATQEYRLVFLGRISPKATSLTLKTNDGYSGSTSEYSTTPTMSVGPIPVVR